MTTPMNIADDIDAARNRILLVDDIAANLHLMMRMLTERGFTVHPAISGATALQFVETNIPDLIVTDIMMPGMDGYELCEHLKRNERTRDIPVIFISSADQEINKKRAFDSGGVDYMVRPVQPEELLARVRTHLSLRNLQRRLEELVEERTAELIQANILLRKENAERKLAEQRVLYAAHYDALTGLPNRVLLHDRIKQAIVLAQTRQVRTAVLLIDLDHFKHINDSLGHQVGDNLLLQVTQRLQECLREGVSLARLGGDEFVLSLPSLVDGNDAAKVAQGVLKALERPFLVDIHELYVRASIGISLYPDDGVNVENLMRAADTAMYHAKKEGRGNFKFFTPVLNSAAQQRLGLENRLRQALVLDEFEVYYQPQVDMESGQIFSAEALLRWRQQGAAPISCGPYISIAEESGLILPIGEWVLRKACEQLRRWHDLGFPSLRIAVNLSPRQFCEPSFPDTIARILKETGLLPSSLELEITESILLQRSDENVAMLKQLSAMGIQLSIDDFGTGYSSLAYLQRFPVHALKIDQSFISGIGKDTGNTALVEAIIAMARSLHLEVLAEGVETVAQVNFLKSNGCFAAQGFHYSKAVTVPAFTDLLQRQQMPIGYAVD